MQTCIFCRKLKDPDQFNNEHVIPDSIGGYYHLYTVCIDCNNKLGVHIDHRLTNHKFIEFQRFLSGLKGKKSGIPNPFAGTHQISDDPEQKVTLKVDKDGVFQPSYVTRVIKDDEKIPSQLTIVVDKKNEKEIGKILSKFLSRNGLNRDKVKSEMTYSKSHPKIEVTLEVDIRSFKLGILKIAYEFATDQLPDYLGDPLSLEIVDILTTGDETRLNQKLPMYGNGFQSELLKPFEWLLDFSAESHYLVLYVAQNIGTICFVRLFNTFSLGFLVSRDEYAIPDGILIGKNDIKNKKFGIWRITEILNELYASAFYRFEHYFPDQSAADIYFREETLPDFAFYMDDGNQPLYDEFGNVKYQDIRTKLKQVHLQQILGGDLINEITTQYILDEPLFIKIMPSGLLIALVSVLEVRQRKAKF